MIKTEMEQYNGKLLGKVLGHFDMYEPAIVLTEGQNRTFDYRNDDDTLYRGNACYADEAVNAYCAEHGYRIRNMVDWWHSNSENVVVLVLAFESIKSEEE